MKKNLFIFCLLLVPMLITFKVLAESFNNCPHKDDWMYKDAEIEIQGFEWDAIPLSEKRKIKTNKGSFNCIINENKSEYSIGSNRLKEVINCDNGAEITLNNYVKIMDNGEEVQQPTIVKDKNNSIFSMEKDILAHKVNCKEEVIVETLIIRIFQKAFEFELYSEDIYKRKIIKPPSGF